MRSVFELLSVLSAAILVVALLAGVTAMALPEPDLEFAGVEFVSR